MEDDTYWRAWACEMRERAARTKDSIIAAGFLLLAERCEHLAEDGVRWLEPDSSHPRGLQGEETRAARGARRGSE